MTEREALLRLVETAEEYSPREEHDWRCEYRTAEAGWQEGEPPVIRCECGFEEFTTALEQARRFVDESATPAAPELDEELLRAIERHSTDPVPACNNGHHVLNLARNVIEARPAEGTCDHCGQLAPCTERRIAVAFVDVMDAGLRAAAARKPE